MDRRQRKTREAIFKAFTELLSAKDFDQITVGEIIKLSDVGRSTFYSHFETKDFLLKELCEELGFCKEKVCKLLSALERHDLLERRRQGLGKPDLLFLKQF